MEVLPTHQFQPDILLMGYRIGEPVITITGLLVTLVCLIAWKKLREIPTREGATRLSTIFFALMGLSTLVGAFFGHAFLYAFGQAAKLPGWVLSMVALSALVQATATRIRHRSGVLGHRILTWANMGFLAFFLWLATATMWFPAVEIHAAMCLLLLVLPMEFYRWRVLQSSSALENLKGIGYLLLAAATHIFKVSLSKWFCFFDIAHLLMCAAIWQFFKAAWRAIPEAPENQEDTAGPSS